MASLTGCRVLFLLWIFGIVSSDLISVNFDGKWRQDTGWHMVCSWQFDNFDTLQSVVIYRGKNQAFRYRPQEHTRIWNSTNPSPYFGLAVQCFMLNDATGNCNLQAQPFAEPDTYEYGCEVSGERPSFRTMRKDYTAYVTPSPAKVDAISSESTTMYNCSSSGIPAPRLVWTIGDQQVQPDFNKTEWDRQSRLFRSWSTLRPAGPGSPACTAEITVNNTLIRGQPANTAPLLYGSTITIALSAIALLFS